MVDIHKLRTTWLLLILICFVTSDYITVGPQDTVVESKQRIMLTCSANFRTGASIWWSIIGENSKDIYKYEGSGGIILPLGSGKYEVRPMDENRGIFDLYIYDVQWYDGGTYECRYIYPQQGIDDGAIADVVIVERPVITQTPQRPLDGELVTVWCSVSFGTPFNLTEEDSMLPYIAVYYQGVQLLDGEYTEVINPPNIIYSIADAVLLVGFRRPFWFLMQTFTLSGVLGLAYLPTLPILLADYRFSGKSTTYRSLFISSGFFCSQD